MLCRYLADASDEEALEPVEDPVELALLSERISEYFSQKGAEVDF